MEESGQIQALSGSSLKMVLQVPFNRWLGGSECRAGRFGAEEKMLPLPGSEKKFLGCPARRLAIISTELSTLICHIDELT